MRCDVAAVSAGMKPRYFSAWLKTMKSFVAPR
jgi:hypothetical protein